MPGADAGNYTVNSSATTTADITALAIVGIVTATNKVYDGIRRLPSRPEPSPAWSAATMVLRRWCRDVRGPQRRNRQNGHGNGLVASPEPMPATTRSTASRPRGPTSRPPCLRTWRRLRIAVNTPFPTFGGSVEGFVGGDTLASSTIGALSFDTTAPDSSQIGAYAIDGSGLSANFGNYVFVQDAANATALIVTPRARPVAAESGLEGSTGAIATALQTQGSCTGLQEAEGQALCGPRTSTARSRYRTQHLRATARASGCRPAYRFSDVIDEDRTRRVARDRRFHADDFDRVRCG